MDKKANQTFIFSNPNTEEITKDFIGRWMAQICLPVMEQRIMKEADKENAHLMGDVETRR